jgi:hypothetical protein
MMITTTINSRINAADSSVPDFAAGRPRVSAAVLRNANREILLVQHGLKQIPTE